MAKISHRFLLGIAPSQGVELASELISDEHWDDAHWELQTPLREFLQHLDRARTAVYDSRLSAPEHLQRYFALLYVFEVSTRHALMGRALEPLSQPRDAAFAWSIVSTLSSTAAVDNVDARDIRFPVHWIQLELFFTGIALARVLFGQAEFAEAAVVYHAVVTNLKVRNISKLHFFSNGFLHESEFCLLVERFQTALGTRAPISSADVYLAMCNRLEQLTEESPFIDARYCRELQLLLKARHKLPARCFNNNNSALDDDDGDDHRDIATGNSETARQWAQDWATHVVTQQSDALLLQMIATNVPKTLGKQRDAH